ncbi:uncharacterized protein LOC132954050 isoform X2 [Labrus mixtus]|uniref:uncharacterized protein LOC132954050 isoform X2 n=1 Tax=Labrus mixtus TaxID=508554 RepID=UPI0029BFAB50|nr:uncharacterized protein LOC132954050 isoform X2 [Labrus mixtus]
MTSRRYVTCIFVFVSLRIVHSFGCNLEYFSKDKLSKEMPDIPLVRTKDPKDVMECTIERACMEKTDCGLEHLFLCFRDKVPDEPSITEKCKGDFSHKVTYHHFLCLTAKAANLHAVNLSHIGCEYDVVCAVYKQIKFAGQTTTFPPPSPTTTETTTIPPTTTETTTIPPTTTETTTIPPINTLPERTTVTAVLRPPTTTTTTTSPQGIHDTNSRSETHIGETETLSLKILLVVSMILHVVVPVAVYLYMRRQRQQDLRPVSSAQMPSTNGRDVEMSHLMQAAA